MKTFIILKPDAVFRGLVGKILSRFEQAGMKIFRMEMRFKNQTWFKQHYHNLIVSSLKCDYLEDMASFMVNNPLIGVVSDGDIDKMRLMVGATNCFKAAPGTIRGDFGRINKYCNLVHASDSKEAVDREIELFFRRDNDS